MLARPRGALSRLARIAFYDPRGRSAAHSVLTAAPAAPRRRSRRWRPGGGWQLGLVFLVLLGVNAYVFLFRKGTSVHELMRASSLASGSGPGAPRGAGASSGLRGEGGAEGPGSAAADDDAVVVRGTMKGYIGLSAALAAAGLTVAQADELVRALGSELDLRALQPHHRFEVRLDARTRAVERFVYQLSAVRKIVVERGADDGFRARRDEAELQLEVAEIGGRIESSLHGALSAAGETAALAAGFVDLFSWDINWYTDPREGDEFRVVVEKRKHGGKFYRYGRILAAEYRGDAGRYRAYYYERADGSGAYYDAEGRALRRAYLKTPLEFRRISSQFNRKRFHPILHRTKGHLGVDYAAPQGTPVWAAADGVVGAAHPAGGAGNMVVLRHAGGVRTIYMHLHRFAAGLRPGQRVQQHQLIGYVGSTGLSTGPHLHYGMVVNGRPIDPQQFKIGAGPLLPDAERARFLAAIAAPAAKLGAIALAKK